MLKILLTALTALVIVWLLGPLLIPILTRLKPDKTEREIAPEPPPPPTKKKKEPPPKPPATTTELNRNQNPTQSTGMRVRGAVLSTL